MFTVQETTHHGNYRNVRVIELPSLAPSEVAAMVRDCPYVVTRPERVLNTLAMCLESGGSYAHGWTTWEVISESS